MMSHTCPFCESGVELVGDRLMREYYVYCHTCKKRVFTMKFGLTPFLLCDDNESRDEMCIRETWYHYDGLDDIECKGKIINHIPTDLWLVMSHPEFDRVEEPMPDGYTRNPSKETSDRVFKEMSEKYLK